MAIADRIPEMSEKELESFRANAERLKDSGSAIQRQQAEELLPLLDAALERPLRAFSPSGAHSGHVSFDSGQAEAKGKPVKIRRGRATVTGNAPHR